MLSLISISLHRYIERRLVVEMTGKAFRQIISNVLEGKSTLFHCSWGKDRVGVLAAFLLSLLGVGMHDILKDYLYQQSRKT